MSIKRWLPLAGIVALSGLMACQAPPTGLCDFGYRGSWSPPDGEDTTVVATVADSTADPDDGLSSEGVRLLGVAAAEDEHPIESQVVSCQLEPQYEEGN